ncbi:MAG: hypothetical protein HQ514_02555 [Rhodospirillales bacterium]|nr:hypothetical protein [Rhodospirillales bacterium]
MSRMPVLTPDEMDDDQRRVYDHAMATNGRAGRGPSIGYAYAPGLWENNNAASDYFDDCSLTLAQCRIAALVTVRHWNAEYPWQAQARGALAAGVDSAAVEAINNRQTPNFSDADDAAVHAVAVQLIKTGTLDDAGFKSAEEKLGYRRLADTVGVVSHFCKTAMMANVAGAEVPADAPSTLA